MPGFSESWQPQAVNGLLLQFTSTRQEDSIARDMTLNIYG